MGLAFRLTLPADTQFVRVGEIPAMTAKAIHPESENDSEAQEFARAGRQINHEEALDKAIKSGMVTPLNPLSYEHHTFPYGDALRRAIISLDDFKQFAASLQIEVVIWDAPLPTTHLTIVDATAALSEKYGLTKPDKESLLERLLEAAHRGELVVRDSQGFPYTPSHAEIHYYMLERVSEDDLNAWLKKQGVEYRLDRPGQLSITGTAVLTNAKSKKDRRIEAIIKTAALLDYPLLCIPYGGKAELERQCLSDDNRLFTAATFETAWKEAKRRKLIQVENVEQYR